MKSLVHFCLSLILPLVFFSCKNDIKLNAPYKEIPSIYAVLNPYSDVQTIRINKVFLGEGDANVMAKVSDSVNYRPGELTVTMRHSSGTIFTFTEALVTTVNGAFSTQQRVYQYDQSVSGNKKLSRDTGSVYTLIVKNNTTGTEFTAKASPVLNIPVSLRDGNISPPYFPYPAGTLPQYYIDYYNYPASVLFVATNSRSKIYQVVLANLFYNDLGTQGQTYDHVEYYFPTFYSKDASYLGSNSLGPRYVSYSFRREEFFPAIGQALAKKNLSNDVLGRKMYLLEYHIYASTQEYADFLEYNKPSLSFNQNKPLYSNFEGRAALGIFTFRSETIIQKEMARSFINAFSSHPSTCQYKFYDSDGHLLGCN